MMPAGLAMGTRGQVQEGLRQADVGQQDDYGHWSGRGVARGPQEGVGFEQGCGVPGAQRGLAASAMRGGVAMVKAWVHSLHRPWVHRHWQTWASGRGVSLGKCGTRSAGHVQGWLASGLGQGG